MSTDYQPTEFERQRELLIREIALVRTLFYFFHSSTNPNPWGRNCREWKMSSRTSTD